MNSKSGEASPFIIGLLAIIVGIGILIPSICYNIGFSNHCEAYLQRAATAPNPEIAKVSLDKAIKYIKDNNLTQGLTWIMIPDTNNDLEWFSSKIFAARAVLDELTPQSKPMEVSNVMIRMKESILTHGESGEHVITPDWISFYPHQILLLITVIVGVMVILLGLLVFFVGLED